jgi:CO/xanthine dehydrogenase FAD-binding subunit
MPEPAFVAPATVPEALAALRTEGAMAVAGGTSIGLLLGQSLIEPSVLVWLGQIPGLRELSFDGATLRVGTAVTLRELSRHPDVRSSLQALAEAAHWLTPIRARTCRPPLPRWARPRRSPARQVSGWSRWPAWPSG